MDKREEKAFTDNPFSEEKFEQLYRQYYLRLFNFTLLAVLLVRYQINQHNEIQSRWITTETVAGQKAKVILPDNSIVWLNSETSLSFSSDFLNQKNRLVSIEGEAYFDVQPQKRKNFIVRSNDYDINVKGTKFNVMPTGISTELKQLWSRVQW